MKKTIQSLCFMLLCGTASVATAQTQLAGTTWQTVAYVPEKTDVILQFKKDTVLLFTVNGKVLLESMTYTEKPGEFTWKKVSGGSPCSPGVPGTYAFSIKEQEMTLSQVNDPCAERAGSIVEPLKKIVGSK